MSENEFINCDVHGKQQTTFVCQHLAESLKTNKVVGFFCSTESSENPRPDAWCINCEEMLQSNSGEWSEEIEKRAGITILCGKCYDMTKKINDIF